MTLTLKQRTEALKKSKAEIKKRIISACREATERAVEKAAALTPPTGSDLSGTNTRSGEMKQHWAKDSVTEPKISGIRYETQLGNNKDYASFVNDGHTMDKHFVPGLYINQFSGMLEYDPSADVGIVVGTKTAYVPGLFMVDQAKEEYKKVLRERLADIGEVIG